MIIHCKDYLFIPTLFYILNAHIFLDIDKFYRLVGQAYDLKQIFKSRNTDMNLVQIKLQEMVHLLYNYYIKEKRLSDIQFDQFPLCLKSYL